MAGQEGLGCCFSQVATFAVGGGRRNEKERRRYKRGVVIYIRERII